MEEVHKQRIFKVILILSILGLLVSVYLVKSYYTPPGKSSVCDFSETISCSAVEESIYARFLGVPVSIFGAMWFIILMVLAWKSLVHRHEKLVTFMLSWIILGILFVIYLVIAEILLKTICPFCTIIHLIAVVLLVLSLMLYKAQENPETNSFFKVPGLWFKVIVVLNIIILLVFNLLPGKEVNQDALVQCLKDKGVTMYSSFRCGVCIKSEGLFGEAAKDLPRVECHPDGPHSQYDLCKKKGILGTPTWIMENNGKEVKRHAGFLSLEELHSFAGC